MYYILHRSTFVQRRCSIKGCPVGVTRLYFKFQSGKCPDKLYRLARTCWQQAPRSQPQTTSQLSTPAAPPAEDAERDAEWICGIITLWLDQEWTKLDVHKAVGDASARAYLAARHNGAVDMGDLVLDISSHLSEFDFDETFTGPFDVANKVVEFLMLRDGIDVCCTAPDDVALLNEFNRNFKNTNKKV